MKLLVFQHVAFEILGTLNPLFKSYGFRIRYVNFGRYPDAEPSLDGYHGLVVLGGPMSSTDEDRYPHLNTEVRLIEHALERDMPILGICLGSQLIARALGASVAPNPEKEIGWYDVSLTEDGARDPMLCHFRATEPVFQWHGDRFEMPDGAVHLARSPSCDNQAFRYGDRVYGLQFHLEVDQALIDRWLSVPIHVEELAELEGKIDPDQIRSQTPQLIRRSEELSDATFEEFIRLFGPLQRRAPQPHR